MLKKILILAVLCTGIGTVSLSAQNIQSILTDITKAVVGDKATSMESIIGTWKYSAPDCQFENDNLLAKAGGEAAASQVEQKLETVYQKLQMESCTFTFNADSTYTSSIGKMVSKGTYTFNSTDKTITLKTKLRISVKASVITTGTTMSLLFNADKLISSLKALTGLASKVNTNASTILSLANNYDGLLLGFELKKE